MEKIEAPDFFPPVTLLVGASHPSIHHTEASQPQRALCYIKATFPSETFEKTWLAFFHDLWTPPQVNITVPESLVETLKKSGLFSNNEVEGILKHATEKEWKDALLANTKLVLDQGAFGAPWMWVRNGQGKEEPFFGSDR